MTRESIHSRKERPPLEFNPDIVMEQSGMDLGGALTFLGYHSPDFFTDVSEVSKAFDHFSDAALLLGQSVSNMVSTTVSFGAISSVVLFNSEDTTRL